MSGGALQKYMPVREAARSFAEAVLWIDGVKTAEGWILKAPSTAGC